MTDTCTAGHSPYDYVEDGSDDEVRLPRLDHTDTATTSNVSLHTLFRYADCWDILMLTVGTLAAVAHGALYVACNIILGSQVDSFLQFDAGTKYIEQFSQELEKYNLTTNDIWQDKELLDYIGQLENNSLMNSSYLPADLNEDTFLEEMEKFTIWYLFMGAATLFCAFLQVALWSLPAERQIRHIRSAFLQSALRQEMAWYDITGSGTLTNRLSEDVQKMHDGIGEKFGTSIQLSTTFIMAFTQSFVIGWKLTMVLMIIVPVLIISALVASNLNSKLTEQELSSYAKAGKIAEEVLGAIKTVTAFGGQSKEYYRYSSRLREARDRGIRKGRVLGVAMGVSWVVLYAAYALGFWYGSSLVRNDTHYTPGSFLIIFFSVVTGAAALGQAAPKLQAISTAKAAAFHVFSVIDRKSQIDGLSKSGHCPEVSKGELEFKNIRFSYPTRLDMPVLQGINLHVKPGEIIALVGASGGGKSTLVQLLLRMYDPTQGEILLDGRDIRDLNVAWLRQQVGVVQQEPTLFGTTIGQNIRYGRECVSHEELVMAAKLANAHSFITQLPQQYNTRLGDKGAQLSGGQKQRLAIARALIRNPRILLLDEATSALDNENETLVQKALEKASRGRTIIIVAHRLSTIRHANVICAIQNGVIAEKGSHEELVKLGGIYSNLISQQSDLAEDDMLEESTRRISVERQRRISNEVMESRSRTRSEVNFNDFHRNSKRSVSFRADVKQKSQSKGGQRGSQRKRTYSVRSTSSSVKSHSLAGDDGVVDETNQRRHRSESMMESLSTGMTTGVNRIGSGLNRRYSSSSQTKDKPLIFRNVEMSEEKVTPAPIGRLMRMNGKEWPYICVGCLAAITKGAETPAFAVIFSHLITMFNKDEDDQVTIVIIYCIFLACIGSVVAVADFLVNYMFSQSGERLTLRLRQLAFRSILKQDISYFDHPDNSVGALATRLSTEASCVQGATGSRLGVVFQNLSNIAVGLTLAMVFSWKLTLLIMTFIPVVMVTAAIESRVFSGAATSDKTAMEGAGKVALEAIENVQTVISLTKEQQFCSMYDNCLEKPYKLSRRKAMVLGAAFAISQSVFYCAFAAAFYAGTLLIKSGEMDFDRVFLVIAVLIFGAMGTGETLAFAPDYTKARLAAARLFSLFDKEPSIDITSDSGNKLPLFRGDIRFQEVDFHYPCRREVAVLEGLNLGVEPGSTVALVGPSGCGKTTLTSLLHRFYDTCDGEILVDGAHIKSYNIGWLRQQIGVVSQEPVLFDMTISENIAYGDNTRIISKHEIIQAAKKANIHNFISTLPMGYDTKVGDRGTQLSGGQKQRVAIARALLRDPRILLLDEATSALDADSEKVVQEALDLARAGRTCLVIAHRLSTIHTADKIAVLDRGRVVEMGTHHQLFALRGIYFKLYTQKTLESK